MGKKIDLTKVEQRKGTLYPPPYDKPCLERVRSRLGDAAGLTQFGVNLLRLPPGSWSSQRHWHSAEDEFVYVLEGEVVLATDSGEEILRPGDCAGFKAGDTNAHHLRNDSTRDAVVLEVGARNSKQDVCSYPGIDLHIVGAVGKFTRKDGTPY